MAWADRGGASPGGGQARLPDRPGPGNPPRYLHRRGEAGGVPQAGGDRAPGRGQGDMRLPGPAGNLPCAGPVRGGRAGLPDGHRQGIPFLRILHRARRHHGAGAVPSGWEEAHELPEPSFPGRCVPVVHPLSRRHQREKQQGGVHTPEVHREPDLCEGPPCAAGGRGGGGLEAGDRQDTSGSGLPGQRVLRDSAGGWLVVPGGEESLSGKRRGALRNRLEDGFRAVIEKRHFIRKYKSPAP